MTPDENDVLYLLGGIILHNSVAYLVVTLFYGIYLVLLVSALRILKTKLYKSRPSIAFTVLVLITFVSSSVMCSTCIATLLLQIKYYLRAPNAAPLADRQLAIEPRIANITVPQDWCEAINLIVADGIAVWRAWVLYQKPLWARLLMGTMMLANAVLSLVGCAINSKEVAVFQKTGVLKTHFPLDAARTFMSTATNLTPTILIALMLWKHHRNISRLMSGGMVEQTLVLLLETGAGFCCLQIVSAILTLFYTETFSALALTRNIFTVGMVIVSAIYPLLVIILVHGRKSIFSDETITSNSRFSAGRPSKKPIEIHLSRTSLTHTSFQAQTSTLCSSESHTENHDQEGRHETENKIPEEVEV